MASILSNRDVLAAVMEKSSSISECLRRLGLSSSGNSYKVLIKYCNKYGITIKRMTVSERIAKLAASSTRPLEDLLIEGSNITSSQLKKRLLKCGVLDNKCAECGMLPMWNDKPLVLHLEHKNGVSNDNRKENLCLLCPNCHSQTSTYAGRNIPSAKLKRFKIKLPYTKISWPSTSWLIDQLKNGSNYSKLGRELSVTDNAVRKRIKNHPND